MGHTPAPSRGRHPAALRQLPSGLQDCPHDASCRHHLAKAGSVIVAQVEHALPQLEQDRQFLDAFTSMVRNGAVDVLADWLDKAKASGVAAFSHGLSADLDAVAAALCKP